MTNKDLAVSKKIALSEIDYLQEQRIVFNYDVGIWYVNFAMIYTRIGLNFLNGVSKQAITIIGSILCNSSAMTNVGTLALVYATPNSFYYDQSSQTLYIRTPNSNDPNLSLIMIGVTMGFSDKAGYYNGLFYDSRLRGKPTFSKSKDPLTFGKLTLNGGSVDYENSDGFFDLIAENDAAYFGAQIRHLQGFEGDVYADFVRLDTSLVQNATVKENLLTVQFVDRRASLSKKLPTRTFDTATYPNINPSNVGKPIPLGYGTLINVDCMCIDENTVINPHTFRIVDIGDHANGIQSIDAVYVNGVSKAFTGSPATGTFTLTSAVYTPGQTVTADIHGFKNGSGTFMSCATDIILDLLSTYFGMTYIAANYNLTEWAAAKVLQQSTFPGGIGLWIKDSKEVFELCDDICKSVLLNLIPQDSGVYTLRMEGVTRAVDQVFSPEEVMAAFNRDYDSIKVVSNTIVQYAKRWADDTYSQINDMSQESVIVAVYKLSNQQSFETLLTTLSDAQTFSSLVLRLFGKVISGVDLDFKMSPLGREITDVVQVPIMRKSGVIQTVLVEILSLDKVPSVSIKGKGRVLQTL